MTTTGIATPVAIAGYPYATFLGIASGPDENIWTLTPNRMLRLATNGSILGSFATWPNGGSYYASNPVVAGPGNTVWFLDYGAAAIGRVTIPPPAAAGSRFNTLTPCRLLDTRLPNGPFGGPILYGYNQRAFAPLGTCRIPLTARSLSVNVTTVGSGISLGYTYANDLILFRSDLQAPLLASSISYVTGRDRANNAIVELSSDGAGSFAIVNRGYVGLHVVVDVNGWFE